MLQGQRLMATPAPGKGSIANDRLHQQHDGLAPILQAQGPHDARPQPRDDDPYDINLFEDLVTNCFDHQDHPDCDLQATLRQCITEHAVGWTMTITLHHIADTLTEEDAHLAHIDLEDWRQLLYRLADYRSWSFFSEDQYADTADP